MKRSDKFDSNNDNTNFTPSANLSNDTHREETCYHQVMMHVRYLPSDDSITDWPL